MASKISTAKLREGHRVGLDGATVLLEGEPRVFQRGRDTWFMWPNMPIIEGRVNGYPEVTVWTIQGDQTCFWTVRGSK